MSYVLVVEDEPQIQRIVARWLTGAGHAVRCASTAAEALELLIAETPALLLCDHGLPDRNGCALVDEARLRAPALKVLMMTGGAPPIACTCSALLQKPFSRTHLIEAVSRARVLRESFASTRSS